MPNVIEQPARGRGAGAGIGEGQEIVAHQPGEMRRHDRERDRERDPRARRRQRLARVAVDEQEQHERRRQHDHEILRPQREPDGEAEQQPMDHAPAPQSGVEGVAGDRPERQLDHVVIELGRGEMEVVQAVQKEDGDEGADGADQRTRGRPDRREGRDHRDLRQRVIGGIHPHQPVDDLDQPPGQRRQLVVAELPFAPIGQGLDEIERQVGIKQRRQDGPDEKMQREDNAEGRLWAALDGSDQSRHRCVVYLGPEQLRHRDPGPRNSNSGISKTRWNRVIAALAGARIGYPWLLFTGSRKMACAGARHHVMEVGW